MSLQRDADTALAESEARYRALVRASSSLVWTTAADGQIVDMPEWRALTGQTIDEVRGWGWLNALHPDDRSRVEVVWQAAVDARSIYETEYRIRHRDGAYVWYRVRGAPVLEDDGGVREWVGLCVNIEDQKRAAQQQLEAEKALRDLNETLEQRVKAEAHDRAQIWNVSQDLLVVADREGKYLNVNPAWTAALGWSEADLVGRPRNGCSIRTIARRPALNSPDWLKATERCGLKTDYGTRTEPTIGCPGWQHPTAGSYMPSRATSPISGILSENFMRHRRNSSE